MLYGQSVRAMAIGVDSDDIVYELGDGRLAFVHLTGHVESLPQCPYTVIFDDFARLSPRRMNGDG